LKYVDIFITHGGMNSTQEWLFFSVPLIVYPSQIEQGIIWSQVEKTWCGILLKKNSVKDIQNAIYKIVNNKFYEENCKKMSNSLHKAWGYKKAVDYIELYLDKKKQKGYK
jgi:UDP:flavonoid glycosyltransferase YjiC (YdhE family)